MKQARYGVVTAVAIFTLGVIGSQVVGDRFSVRIGAIVTMAALPPIVLMLARGPLWALAAYVGSYVFGLYTYSIAIGPLHLRPTDVPYVALLGWAWVARRQHGRATRRPMGQSAWFAYVMVTLLSLYPVWVRGTDSIASPAISWFRLFETVSVIWILPYLLSTTEELQMLLRILTAALAAELTVVLVVTAIHGVVPLRLGGHLGPNALGLESALLLVIAIHTPLSGRARYRWYCVAIALTCLPLTRSIASLTAAALALGIFGLRSTRPSTLRRETLLAPIRLLVLVVGLIGVVSMLRADNLPGSQNFEQSDTLERLILGDAALDLYLHHPVLGVGSSRGGLPQVVGDPALNARLHRRFPNAPPVFFPDVNPSQVHNAYLQVLAETGTAGGLCLLVVVAGTFRGARHALRQPRADLGWRLARATTASLVVVLIWCNDNGLYGGQIETASIGLLVGCLASNRSVRGAEESHATAELATSIAVPAASQRARATVAGPL